MSDEIDKLWREFETWLRDHYPRGLDALNPPATDQAIIQLELKLDVSFPLAFVTSLKIHNGQRHDCAKLFNGMELLSLERIEDEWEVWSELCASGDFNRQSVEVPNAVKPNWWNPNWIPFLYNGAGDHVCLDLDPTAEGEKGQIITMWHDLPKRELVANDFVAWFRHYLDTLTEGDYEISQQHGGIIAAR